MRVFLGEGDKWHGEPLYEVIVRKLRMEHIAGATVCKGILGYGAKGHTHKEQSFFHLSHDCPVMISIIDCEAKIRQAVEIVSDVLLDGLIVTSEANVIRLVHALPNLDPPDATITKG